MAKVGDNYSFEPLFPKVVGVYDIEFDQEELKVLDKWKSMDHHIETSLVTAGKAQTMKAKPYESLDSRKKWGVWNDNFLILHLQKNILKNCKELQSIGDTILQLANHFVFHAGGVTLPENSYLDFSDSWMIRLQGREDGEMFRKHNHAFSWLTGVCYLDDSDCNIMLHNGEQIGTTFESDNYPFIFPEDQMHETPYNKDSQVFDIKRGRVLIFNSRMSHSLNDRSSTDDTRFSFAFNIWPYGMVNPEGGAMLEYEAPQPREDL
jgi:hypothetical protein